MLKSFINSRRKMEKKTPVVKKVVTKPVKVKETENKKKSVEIKENNETETI